MSGKVIADDDEVFTGIRPLHRRHTLGGNSSVASDSALAPNVWRPVMPMGRRSTLVSTSEDVDELRSTIDGSMRTTRAISDATGHSRRPAGKSNFALHDVDALSVQRAKVIRRISEGRYARFRAFFESNEPDMAREIQARSAFSREQLDAWVNYIVSPKVLRCIIRSKDSQQELLDLLMVSAAISKYGESELMAKDRRGDLSTQQNIKLDTYDEYSSSHPEHVQANNSKSVVAMEFVIRVNARLPEERRLGGVVLREILAYASNMQISNETINQGDNNNLDKEEERTRQIITRVQSTWFQDAMIKANGRYLYDAIRQILSNVNEALWDASKDKLELQRAQISEQLADGPEIKLIERRASSERQVRPRMPPPPPPAGARPRMPPPPRPDGDTRDGSLVEEVPSAPAPIHTPVKAGFTIYNRPSSAQEIQERESSPTIATMKMRRKLLPLGSAPRMLRPRAHPPKRPLVKANDPIVHAPSAFVIKSHELE
ncbi:unnamed protein product [Phytophthora fragariaefolia]|uniref:Unnamed protein product n=1 Tax=Phytophthora fragariaefolia TaxID=1490495 RepID=A0A9W7CUQ5_9STRA|nr:unnamed protein product [Phytophthora fragariaefolia]